MLADPGLRQSGAVVKTSKSRSQPTTPDPPLWGLFGDLVCVRRAGPQGGSKESGEEVVDDAQAVPGHATLIPNRPKHAFSPRQMQSKRNDEGSGRLGSFGAR